MSEFPDNVLEMINAVLAGYDRAMGLQFTKATPDEFVAELTTGDIHKQPYGLVHGGVYSGMIETCCSTAAALNVFSDGRSTVGLENATSFLRAARSGKLICTARPLFRGRRSHVWEAEIRDGEDRQVARGRVRLLVLEAGSEAAGRRITLETGELDG